MKKRNHGLSEKEIELVKLLMEDCESTGDIQAKLKRLFAGTIEQMLEAEMDEHLGYEKIQLLETTLETVGTAMVRRRSSAIMASARLLYHVTETGNSDRR